MPYSRVAQERKWEIDGLRISGLSWGNSNLPTIIALHGWLDNAASFAELAPLLENFQVIAIDLPGHGLSDDRSLDATYQIWDDLPQLCKIIEDVSSAPIILMGHSRGAIISVLLASVLGEKVSSIIALDALIPEAQSKGKFVNQLVTFIDERKRLIGKGITYFPHRNDVMQRRCSIGLSLEAAEILASRSLIYVEGKGYYWRSDQRLKGASAVKLTKDDLSYVLKSIEAPVMLIVAHDGYIRDSRKLAGIVDQLKNYEIVDIAGGHHFHLEESAHHISKMINIFLEREI